jgi:methylenetetrahydrofolate dehydrogenase (NADP+) / methenyltetrahydrofolate cyclohydrolase
MPATIIDGKAISDEIRAGLPARAKAVEERMGRLPGLAVMLIGDDPASATYVRMKERACERASIYSRQVTLPAETTHEEAMRQVEILNADPLIDGILVQQPFPKHIDTDAVCAGTLPGKDVDGLHPTNLGELVRTGSAPFLPCTPRGVIELLERSGTEIRGAHAVVCGRSNLVGKPVALLLMARHATITICHSRTVDLPAVCRSADILVAAIGKAEMIRGDWVKPGATVIDVGINRDESNRMVGDVAFDEAVEVAGKITPVPGGVGPMTIAMLLQNVVEAAERKAARA